MIELAQVLGLLQGLQTQQGTTVSSVKADIDMAQDARITALEARITSLEAAINVLKQSLTLMIRARQGAGQ